jgi:hypothetical protein
MKRPLSQINRAFKLNIIGLIFENRVNRTQVITHDFIF